MSKKALNSSGLALLGDYGSSDSDTEAEPVDTSTYIKNEIIEAILTNVVFRANDALMVVDRNPSFDVYRPRKRELSESSSIVTTEPLDLSSDDSSTTSSRYNSNLSSLLYCLSDKLKLTTRSPQYNKI